jgi:hypothetical protein
MGVIRTSADPTLGYTWSTTIVACPSAKSTERDGYTQAGSRTILGTDTVSFAAAPTDAGFSLNCSDDVPALVEI